jgi:TolB-like protein
VHRLTSSILFASLVSLAAAGCSKPPRYVHPSADMGAVKNVAVLPFESLVNEKLAAERVQKIFFTALLHTGVFDLVEPGQVLQTLRRSQIDPAATTPDDIKRLGKELKVQAIEFDDGRSGGSVPAPRVKIQIRMVDTESATTLWSTTLSRSGVPLSGRLFGVGGDPATTVAEDLLREEAALLAR